MGFPSLDGSTAVCPEVTQYPPVLVQVIKLTCTASSGKLGSKETWSRTLPLNWSFAVKVAHLSGSVSPSSLLGATPAKMCAVPSLNPANLEKADMMYSRLSVCLSERKKRSCNRAGQLANFLVLRML